MGILGARSMMDADPARFCLTFTWNCDVDGPDNGADRVNHNCNEHNTLGLLIDASSLLYHVAMKQEQVVYASPSTIHDSCQIHVHRLLRVVGRKGGVHLFFDGLPPREKFPSQIHRMSQQAACGDKLARKDVGEDNQDSVRLLHHLAEWAFVEAVDRLRQRFSNTLHMHRASIGEAEPLINQWLVQNDGKYSRVVIISEDSDFLVYDSCPGFMPPSTLVYEDRNGRHSLRGRYYVRSKFLRSFLDQSTTNDTTVMTTVAALAGCDYCTTAEQTEVLTKMRNKMVKSSLGGLRPKTRNSPSASDALLAILRVVAHYKKYKGFSWLEKLTVDFADRSRVARNGLQIIHGVYMYSLQIADDTTLDMVPGMVEVRRLVQYGVIYCYPVVETFAAVLQVDDSNGESSYSLLPLVRHHFRPGGVQSHALTPCPPLSTQVEMWITRSSIWHFPHFRQIRTRLYSYVRLQVYNGRAPQSIPPGDFWTLSSEPIVEEIVRMKSGNNCSVDRARVTVPEHTLMSTMFTDEALLRDDHLAVDRALVFCILGAPQQLKTICTLEDKAFGAIFLASIMVPFNLACLLIMMATAPRDLANFDPGKKAFDRQECYEVNKILPVLSVACAHANFLVNTIVAFWPHQAPHSRMIIPINVSTTFRHDNALMIWNAIRLGRNLEYLASQESFVADDGENIVEYINAVFDNLRQLRPANDEAWTALLRPWKQEVQNMFEAWWEIFNMEESEFTSIPDLT